MKFFVIRVFRFEDFVVQNVDHLSLISFIKCRAMRSTWLESNEKFISMLAVRNSTQICIWTEIPHIHCICHHYKDKFGKCGLCLKKPSFLSGLFTLVKGYILFLYLFYACMCAPFWMWSVLEAVRREDWGATTVLSRTNLS